MKDRDKNKAQKLFLDKDRKLDNYSKIIWLHRMQNCSDYIWRRCKIYDWKNSLRKCNTFSERKWRRKSGFCNYLNKDRIVIKDLERYWPMVDIYVLYITFTNTCMHVPQKLCLNPEISPHLLKYMESTEGGQSICRPSYALETLPNPPLFLWPVPFCLYWCPNIGWNPRELAFLLWSLKVKLHTTFLPYCAMLK